MTRSDILKARDEEERRHKRENDAVYIATALEGYSAADRAYIRRRVQELLRCTDESTAGDPIVRRVRD